MIRLLTDENFNQRTLRGLQRRLPQLDFVLVRDVGLAGFPDLVLLKWATNDHRTILTHDVSTMVPDAERLIAIGEPMAGVIVVPEGLGIGRAIHDLELVLECYSQSEMRNRIEYLPL